MKLLLTSNGFSNPTIIKAFKELTDAQFHIPISELNLVFVTTASNAEGDDKGWLIDDMKRAYDLGFNEMDVLEFMGVLRENWEARIRNADILMFGGGDTQHLMKCLEVSGLKDVLSEIKEEKIYVGISAGSMVTAPTLAASSSQELDSTELAGTKGLDFVSFLARSHLNNDYFPTINPENMEKYAKHYDITIYALDDNSAVKVDGDKVEVASEGEWKVFNGK